MSPGAMSKTNNIKLGGNIIAAICALLLAGCAQGPFGNNMADNHSAPRAGVLNSFRPSADPAMVARIREEQLKEAQKRAAQPVIAAQTGGPETIQPNLGRMLPNVSTDPISPFTQTTVESMNTSASVSNSANQNDRGRQGNNARAISNPPSHAVQAASYETSYYNAVPPPPAGGLAGSLVPPPPAVTLSTQASAYTGADSAANFYNNPYFNPYGIPAPPQAAALPTPRRSAYLVRAANAINQIAIMIARALNAKLILCPLPR